MPTHIYNIRRAQDGRKTARSPTFFSQQVPSAQGALNRRPTSSHHPGVASPDLIPYLGDVLPEEAKELRVLEVAVLVYLRHEGLERALDALRRRLRLLLVTTFFVRFV